jgi:ABC-type protease/lipase transport system fused ATPase/permease subunit
MFLPREMNNLKTVFWSLKCSGFMSGVPFLFDLIVGFLAIMVFIILVKLQLLITVYCEKQVMFFHYMIFS